jgi:hypothetical protein
MEVMDIVNCVFSEYTTYGLKSDNGRDAGHFNVRGCAFISSKTDAKAISLIRNLDISETCFSYNGLVIAGVGTVAIGSGVCFPAAFDTAITASFTPNSQATSECSPLCELRAISQDISLCSGFQAPVRPTPLMTPVPVQPRPNLIPDMTKSPSPTVGPSQTITPVPTAAQSPTPTATVSPVASRSSALVQSAEVAQSAAVVATQLLLESLSVKQSNAFHGSATPADAAVVSISVSFTVTSSFTLTTWFVLTTAFPSSDSLILSNGLGSSLILSETKILSKTVPFGLTPDITESDLLTASDSFGPTRTFGPSPTFSPSSTFTVSSVLNESLLFSLTVNAKASPIANRTPAFSQSPLVDPTDPLASTNPILATFSLRGSSSSNPTELFTPSDAIVLTADIGASALPVRSGSLRISGDIALTSPPEASSVAAQSPPFKLTEPFSDSDPFLTTFGFVHSALRESGELFTPSDAIGVTAKPELSPVFGPTHVLSLSSASAATDQFEISSRIDRTNELFASALLLTTIAARFSALLGETPPPAQRSAFIASMSAHSSQGFPATDQLSASSAFRLTAGLGRSASLRGSAADAFPASSEFEASPPLLGAIVIGDGVAQDSGGFGATAAAIGAGLAGLAALSLLLLFLLKRRKKEEPVDAGEPTQDEADTTTIDMEVEFISQYGLSDATLQSDLDDDGSLDCPVEHSAGTSQDESDFASEHNPDDSDFGPGLDEAV